MAVPVVGTDAHDGVPSGHRVEQGEVDVARPVVRHGEDVHVEQCRRGRVPEQCPMGGRAGVARQQHAAARAVDAKHQRGLVLLAVQPLVGARVGRSQHAQAEVADHDLLPTDWCVDGHGGRSRVLQHLGERRRWRRVARALPDRGHVDGREDGGRPTGVVLVAVRQDEEVEDARPVASQPAGGPAVPPGVHEHGGPCRRQQERIPLTDVDRGQDERTGRAGCGQRRGEPRTHDHRGGHPAPTVEQQPPHRREHAGQHGGLLPPHHRAPPLQPARDPEDDAERRASEPQQDRGQPGRRQHDHGRCSAQQGGHRGGGHRDHVRRQRRQCHVPTRGEQDRQHGDLRPDRHGEQVEQSS